VPEGDAAGRGALSPGEFGAAFKAFLEQSTAQAPRTESVLAGRLRSHLGADPAALPIVSEDYEPAEHPNLQVALDAWTQEPGRSSEAVGIAHDKRFGMLGLSDLIGPRAGTLMGGGELRPGPVEWVNRPLDGDRVLTCVQFGLLLARDGQRRLAVLVQGPADQTIRRQVRVEVMAADRDLAQTFLTDLRLTMRARSVYRGQVISLAAEQYGPPSVRFHALPVVARDDIVLADGVLERVELHTIRFAAHRDRLLAAGRHLRRGLLLHGKPGTGKTLTAMYLAGQQPDRTVLLVTGREVGLLRRSCELARLLAPSTVVLEDVDLIAEERTRQEPGCTILLFELLNEMDGLADDVDVVFVLTSNRPELLEPALAARPGRVDLAVEVPLPDAACRRRLLELYGRGLTLRVTDMDQLVERTEGVSPAFIRELLRKAALLAVGPGDEIVVEDGHLTQAIRELVADGSGVTRRLLGWSAS
jgi:ATPase family associated with various cellular activities (AAA)